MRSDGAFPITSVKIRSCGIFSCSFGTSPYARVCAGLAGNYSSSAQIEKPPFSSINRHQKLQCLPESFMIPDYSIVKCLAPISEAKFLANRSATGMGLTTSALRTNFLIRAKDADTFGPTREPVERPSLITIRSIAG
jgi:hypothetical protein